MTVYLKPQHLVRAIPFKTLGEEMGKYFPPTPRQLVQFKLQYTATQLFLNGRKSCFLPPRPFKWNSHKNSIFLKLLHCLAFTLLLFQMMNIYDSEQHHLVIGPFDWEPVERAEFYATLPDPVIRQVFFLVTFVHCCPLHLIVCDSDCWGVGGRGRHRNF